MFLTAGRISKLTVDAGDVRDRRPRHRVTFDELPHAGEKSDFEDTWLGWKD